MIIPLLFGYAGSAYAIGEDTKGEGMWLPIVLDKMHEDRMKEKGMEIDAEDIYNINQSSIKDAVIRLDGGSCTAEVVSEDGLLFTNHHCAYDMISKHSTEENNYLEEGFWAESHEDEIRNKNYTASRLVRMEDVTSAIAPVMDTLEGRAKKMVQRQLYDSLKKDATEGTHYNASIESMYHNNEYYMMVYETFRDIRLVGAPPSDIGKFGGDTDNWTWPRHTGDFSILRIYTGPDGKPAPYSEENVPYDAKHHLPISLDGYDKGDFSMIMGYPGTTERYLSSHAIEHKMNEEQPTIIDVWDVLLTNMEEKMDESKEAELKLASFHASISNYHKYYKGQLKGLKNLDLAGKKAEKEEGFQDWYSQDEELEEKYGDVLPTIDKQYEKIDKISPGFYYYRYGLRFMQSIRYANRFNQFKDQLASLKAGDAPKAKIDTAVMDFRKRVQQFFGNTFIGMQKATLRELLVMYGKNVPQEQRPAFFNNLIQSHPGQSVKETINTYLDKTFHVPAERRQDLLGYSLRLNDLRKMDDSDKTDSLADELKQDILTYYRKQGVEDAKSHFEENLVSYFETSEFSERPRDFHQWLGEVKEGDTTAKIRTKVSEIFSGGLFANQTVLADTASLKEAFNNWDSEMIKEDPLIRATHALEGEKALYKSSIVFDSAKTMAFLNDPDPWTLENERFLDFGSQINSYFRSNYAIPYRQAKRTINEQMTVFMEGLRKWQDDKTFYPNANSTMRVNDGVVEPYKPRDAVSYHHFTTYKGVMEKADPDDEEFDVPDKLKKLFREKDFGRYGVDGTLKLCFLTDNDITGGNSGSPVINGKGHLMGIAFDGNWESMTGDLVVDESVNRTISVDIRYVLFVIDKFAGSDHIMDELDIVDSEG